jgi:hypothetical protein
VVHCVRSNPARGGAPAGMGIQFQALRKEFLELIDKYVNSLMM